MNGFPPLHNLSLHSRSLCLLHTYTHPKHLLPKIKGLEPSPIPNSILSLICWPVAHRSFSCSVPLASHQHTPSHTYKPPFAQTGSVSQSRLTEERMQLVSSLSLLLLPLIQVCVCFPGANLTSNLDRIKIVFTPMRCRRVCNGGHCYNSCEKGDVTTVYSETSQHHQQQQPKNQGFRLCEWCLRGLNPCLTPLLVILFTSSSSSSSFFLFPILSCSLKHCSCVSIPLFHCFFYGVILTK